MFVGDVVYQSSCQYPPGGGEVSPGLQGIRVLRKFPISFFPNDSYFYPGFKIYCDLAWIKKDYKFYDSFNQRLSS